MEAHTRSLWRRLLAILIDITLIGLVSSLLIYPLANTLESPWRVSSGLFNANRCNNGSVFDSGGRPISWTGWDRAIVCDMLVNGLFPSRTAIFVKSHKDGAVTTTQTVKFPISENNRFEAPLDSSVPIYLLLPLLLAVFEASAWMATPGKKILGLRVASANGEWPTMKQTLARNYAKLFFVLLFLPLLPSYFQSASERTKAFEKAVFTPELTVRPASEVMASVLGVPFVVWIAVAAGNIILILTIFFPWRSAGRALYDRVAGTLVIRV
jgi:uncharacterized RDD family membrane protein YckC